MNRLATGALAIIATLVFLAPEALAAEASGEWREIYDLTMKWVNFIILAALLVKFGKGPIMDFLRGQKLQIKVEIDRLESQKAGVESHVEETYRQLEESEAHFQTLKERIVRQGKKKKEAIVEDARRQSQLALNMATQRIENQLLNAKKTFRDELIDAAVNRAMEQMPEQITDEDNQRLLNQYLKSVTQF